MQNRVLKYSILFLVIGLFVFSGLNHNTYANSDSEYKSEVIIDDCGDCLLLKAVKYSDESSLMIFNQENQINYIKELKFFDKNYSQIWSRDYEIYERVLSAGNDETIFAEDFNENGQAVLIALNKNGKELWRYNTKEDGAITKPLIDSNGTVYISQYNHTGYIGPYSETYVHAISKDGKLKWRKLVEGEGVINLLDNQTVLVATSNGNQLYNFDLNGKLIWKQTFPTDEAYFSFTDASVLGNKIFVSFTDTASPEKGISGFYVFDYSKKLLWKNTNINYSTYEVFDQNKIVYTSEDKVYAITADGKELWSYIANVNEDSYVQLYEVTSKGIYLSINGETSKIIKLDFKGNVLFSKDTNGNSLEVINENKGYLLFSRWLNGRIDIQLINSNNGNTLSSFSHTTTGEYFYPQYDGEDVYYSLDNKVYKISNKSSSSNEPPLVQFKPWDKQFNNVEPNKTWTINFSKEIDETTLNKESIFITDINGTTIIPVDFKIGDDKKSIKVTPLENYKNGQTYYLKINNLKSSQADELQNPIVMTFTVK